MGSTTYKMPTNGAEVTVDYRYSSEEGAIFETASMDGIDLCAEHLFVKETCPSPTNPFLREDRFVSLASFFQSCLDNDPDIEEDERSSYQEAAE